MNHSFLQEDTPTAILNLVDMTNKCLQSFNILDQKISGFSETFLMYLILQKLDHGIKFWWEQQLKSDGRTSNVISTVKFS